MSKSLTLSKLSEYDDLLTDHLIDKVHYWITTHKADRKKFHSSRSARTHDIVIILQKHVVAPRSKIQDALVAFLNLSTVSIFHRNLNAAEKIDFERHARKYLSIYHPQAGFEISSTERYTKAGPKAESCIIANKPWAAREVIKFLTGTIVAMTQEEEDFYEAGHDFSILHSSRLDSMCLFLGPARFVNHDCCPNGTFVTQGTSVSIATTKPVKIGEEITVFYSPDYFGPNNADCLCATCEAHSAGGYRSQAQKELDAKLMSQSIDASSPNQKRNRVDALEIVTDEQTNESSIKAPRLTASPPNTELSLEDIAKIAYLSSDDEFHSMPEASDDEDIAFNIRLPDGSSKPETAVDALSHDSDHPDGDEIAYDRKVLRPRKSRHDYNLKRQSAASLHAIDVLRPQGKYQHTNKIYCQVCSEGIPGAGIVEEIWSISESLGLKKNKCKRCDRHSKIYGAAWPKRSALIQRTPSSDSRPALQTQRADSPIVSLYNQINNGDESFFQKTSIRVPGFQGVLSHWSLLSDGNYIHSSLEPAKAHMRRGALSGSRLGATFPIRSVSGVRLSTPDRIVVDQHNTFLNRGKSVKVSSAPHNSFAQGLKRQSQSSLSRGYLSVGHVDDSSGLRCCTSCRQKNKKYSLQIHDAQRCDRCIRLRKGCESSASRRQGTSQKSRKSSTDINGAQTSSRGSSLSPDSELAALQVTSPHRLPMCSRSRETFASGPRSTKGETELGVASVRSAKERGGMKKPVIFAGKSVIPLHIEPKMSPEKNASSNLSPPATPSFRKKAKSRSRHSWVYVEVHSDDDNKNKRPEILKGRTRRQSHKIATQIWPAPSSLADNDEAQPIQVKKRRRLYIRSDSDSETSQHASLVSSAKKNDTLTASINDNVLAQQIAKSTDTKESITNSEIGTLSMQNRAAVAKLMFTSDGRSPSFDHATMLDSLGIMPQASFDRTSQISTRNSTESFEPKTVYRSETSGEISTLGVVESPTPDSIIEQGLTQEDVPELASDVEPPRVPLPRKIRRPRKQMWEYVSITSDDDRHEKAPEILPDRAARRKSAPVYRG